MNNLIKTSTLLDGRLLVKKGVIAASFLFFHIVCAQAQESPANEEASSEATETGRALEEVVVTGRKSTLAMQYQILRAEDAVYEEYNKLNAGTEFEMICAPPAFRDNFTGLLPSARKRVCTTAFVHDENANALQDALAGFATVEPDVEEHNQKVKEKLLALYAESPAFREHISTLIALRKDYETASTEQDEERTGFFQRMFGGKE